MNKSRPAYKFSILSALLPSLFAAPAVFAAGAGVADAGLPIERVVLSTAGVGYFQHGGTITGNAAVSLDFTPQQLNDLLKSLVAQDFGGGTVAAVDYPGNEPLKRLLDGLGVNLSGNRSLAQLFVQLRGANARFSLLGGETLQGRILGTEKRQRAAGETAIESEFVSIAGSDGIRAIDIDTIRRFELLDPRLQEALTKALDALAESGNNDKKPVTVHFNGEGARRVALGYVVEAPLWKTSYRLTLPAAMPDSGKPMLQGWAIVENNSANDWRGVELALVSGRPLSFIEKLYQSQYLPRPVHEPEHYTSIAPQAYKDGVDMVVKPAPAPKSLSARAARVTGAAMGEAGFNSAALDAKEVSSAERVPNLFAGGYPLDLNQSVSAAAETERLGATFQYVISNVDLPGRRSAMLPIVNEAIEAERLSIYDRTILAGYPLHGVRLINRTGKHLPGGPLSVFEANSYAGDARIDDLPDGGERLLSFAIDLDVSVQQREADIQNTLNGARIENGVLMLQQISTKRTTYAFKNNADEGRKLLLTHPVSHGWTLDGTPEPAERTESQYRFRMDLAPRKSDEFSVQERRTDWEHSYISEFNEQSMLDLSSNGALPQTVRDKLKQAAELRRAIADADQSVAMPTQRIKDITEEQERIRANLQSLERGSALHERLVKRLDAQETELETLQAAIAGALTQQQAANKAFSDFLAKLNIE